LVQVGFHMGPVVLRGVPLEQQWREHIEQVAAASDEGFRFFSVGTHYVIHPFQYFNIFPWLARLHMAAPNLDVVSSVVLVPLGHPVDIASQVATLDAITGGRFKFGCGLGYRPIEFEIFGVERKHRAPIFEESLELMVRLWSGEEVHHEGRFFRLDGERLSCLPVQTPHPPIWIATNSERATRRAARMGDAPFWSPFFDLPTLKDHRDLFDEERKAAGREPPLEIPLAREYSVGRTRAQAVEDGAAGMAKKWEVYAEHGLQGSLSEDDKQLVDDFETMASNTFIIGDPGQCAEEIERYVGELGITHVKLRLQYPGMPHSKVMERIRLTGEVIRRLERS
jgi:alkanesulfonate monooxygenase SsuD/methylene tetrahydromethanopterin reductase-like flavin-dependent oxidoreductase (luciferase family)